ncbi:hypothetical protein Csa_017747 [Cucumis sativus]|nr:hypothetical protein Csa_017747 [Cucumis sativus]
MQPKDGEDDSDHTHKRQRRPKGGVRRMVRTTEVLHTLNGQTPDHQESIDRPLGFPSNLSGVKKKHDEKTSLTATMAARDNLQNPRQNHLTKPYTKLKWISNDYIWSVWFYNARIPL